MAEFLIETWLEHRCTVEALQYVRAVCTRGPTDMEERECHAFLTLPRDHKKRRRLHLTFALEVSHPRLETVPQSIAMPEAYEDDMVLSKKWIRRWARLLTVTNGNDGLWRYWANLRWAFLQLEDDRSVLRQRLYAAALEPHTEPLGFNLYSQRMHPSVLRAVLLPRQGLAER